MSDRQWQHVPSCPCFQCEDYRKENGMSCMYYGPGGRPDTKSPEHNWRGQEALSPWVEGER